MAEEDASYCTGDGAPITPETVGRLYAHAGPQMISGLHHLFAWPLAGFEPEDVVQETAARLWKSPDRFDPSRGRLEDFFFGMCVKVAQELARKADRLRKLEGAERDVATPDDIPGPDPLGDAERPSEKLLAALQEAIEVLPEPLRAIIQADLDAGGTAPTGPLAAKLGINPATVRTRRYRGRHDLREFLEKRGFTGLFD